MSQSKGVGPVGQMNNASRQQPVKPAVKPPVQPPVQPPTPRSITWAVKPNWTVGEEITASAITLGVSAGPANAALTAPAVARLAKAGKLTITAQAPAAEGFALATSSVEVDVAKAKSRILWRQPLPVLVGAKLDGSILDAKVLPGGQVPTYAPAANTVMATAKQEILTASFAGDDGYEAATAKVTLFVVANAAKHAEGVGVVAMNSGRGWKPGIHAKAQEALDSFQASDPNDPTSLAGQAKTIMANINNKTPDELMAYMNTLVTKPEDKEFRNTKPDGKPKAFPNHIWKLPNGLQVRFKPNGDGRDATPRSREPMFCLEMRRTDIPGFADDPSQTAFKITPGGTPAPYGPAQMELPPLANATLDSAALKAACDMTHLGCAKMQAQVVTWAPITVEVGTALTAEQLLPSVLDKAKVTVTRVDNGAAVKAGDTLPAGTYTLRAAVEQTLRYLAATKDVTLTVKRKAQTITWKGASPRKPSEGFTDADVTRLGDAPLTFIASGSALVKGAALTPNTQIALTIRADQTDTYEMAMLKVTVQVQAAPTTGRRK